MKMDSLHNPDRYMADLRQILSQGRKRIGLLIGAGAPTAICVDENNRIVNDEDGSPLIPDVKGLTDTVVSALGEDDKRVIKTLEEEIDDAVNIEAILTKVRRLAEAIGGSSVHELDSGGYNTLSQRICEKIGESVRVNLPVGDNPYSDIISWIAGTQREHSIEIFTPNYDLLIEEAFGRARVPYFDGFVGSHEPFFDPASVSLDKLPARWTRVWKLHGSLGWTISDKTVIRTGQDKATELIYPDHLKYNQVTRLPYSALFERLSQFLKTPDSLLLCSGFSFSDAHICAVLDEALATNAHTALLAFQYRPLEEEEAAVHLAHSRPNMSVYSPDCAVINGVAGYWQPSHPPNEDWREIRRTFWRGESSTDQQGEFLLGDFSKLARFLALIQARQLSSPVFEEDDSGLHKSLEFPKGDNA